MRNWSGTAVLANPQDIRAPRDVDDVATVVRGASGPIRVLAKRFSWTRLISASDALALDMRHFVGVTGTTPTTITALANTTLHDLHEYLRPLGRRLDCSPPVIPDQSVAGAIATGTHGQGLKQATVGDAVVSLTLVDGGGEVRTVSRDHTDFGAFQMHLGCLGVVVSVELRTTTLETYTCKKVVVPYNEFVRTFVDLNRTYEFCKAWWFPSDSVVHLWLVRPADEEESQACSASGLRTVDLGTVDTGINATVERYSRRMAEQTLTQDRTRIQFETLNRFRDFSGLVGDLYDILCRGIPVPQLNCELGVALEDFEAVQSELAAWRRRSAPTMHYPIILRSIGPSDAWMSPAYRRQTCFYGFVVYQASDGSYDPRAKESLRDAQHVLGRHGGLPHVGKYFDPAAVPAFDPEQARRFRQVQRAVDPSGRFTNEYLERLLHPR